MSIAYSFCSNNIIVFSGKHYASADEALAGINGKPIRPELATAIQWPRNAQLARRAVQRSASWEIEQVWTSVFVLFFDSDFSSQVYSFVGDLLYRAKQRETSERLNKERILEAQRAREERFRERSRSPPRKQCGYPAGESDSDDNSCL